MRVASRNDLTQGQKLLEFGQNFIYFNESGVSEMSRQEPQAAKPTMLKTIVLGNKQSGISSVIARLLDGNKNTPFSELATRRTIGLDFQVHSLNVSMNDGTETEVKMQVWDHCEETYRHRNTAYFYSSHNDIVIVVIDTQLSPDEISQQVNKWNTFINKYMPDHVTRMIVGSKADLIAADQLPGAQEHFKAAVIKKPSSTDAEALSESSLAETFSGCLLVSAEDGMNVQLAFEQAAKAALMRLEPTPVPVPVPTKDLYNAAVQQVEAEEQRLHRSIHGISSLYYGFGLSKEQRTHTIPTKLRILRGIIDYLKKNRSDSFEASLEAAITTCGAQLTDEMGILLAPVVAAYQRQRAIHEVPSFATNHPVVRPALTEPAAAPRTSTTNTRQLQDPPAPATAPTRTPAASAQRPFTTFTDSRQFLYQPPVTTRTPAAASASGYTEVVRRPEAASAAPIAGEEAPPPYSEQLPPDHSTVHGGQARPTPTAPPAEDAHQEDAPGFRKQ